MKANPKPTPQIIPRLSAPTSSQNTDKNALGTSTALRWHSVVTRDQRAKFVYAVLTTKIYCRPSCAARLARRANVEFYDTPTQAERAGFRPCKRCKPETLKPVINPQVLAVQRAVHTVRGDVRQGRKTTLNRLAGEAGLTPSHFHRVFKKVMGVTPGVYVAGLLREGAGLVAGAGGTDTQGCDTEVEERMGEVLVEGDSSALDLEGEDQGIDKMLFQPWDEQLCTDLDAWLVGDSNWDAGPELGLAGVDVQGALLWNDFDVLIAAEAELASDQGLDSFPLTGAPGLTFDSYSPNSGVSGESAFSFVGV
ncbi:putative DNA repair and transcription factor Ada [Aspergillus undulatus]|uniref:putative DNA repair and transcription factor Ada n=1 Tax=Aspergillus undulatus TaxID=1810928 RepID=UPI003CCD944F